jgi:hypothetical protein
VTDPLEILGVYVEVSEFILEKEPLGVLQVEVVALPPIVPDKVTEPPPHIVWGTPAFAVAAWFTVIKTVDVAAGQGPAGSFVVSVNSTEPLAILGV